MPRAEGFKRNWSFDRPICFHNLESVGLSDRLPQPSVSLSDFEISQSLNINENINRAANFLKHPVVSSLSYDIYNGHHYVSRSCPHSRRQSPTRRQNKRKALNYTDLDCFCVTTTDTDNSDAWCCNNAICNDDNGNVTTISSAGSNDFCLPQDVNCNHGNINANSTVRDVADNSAFCRQDSNYDTKSDGRTKTDVDTSFSYPKNNNRLNGKDVNLNDLTDVNFTRNCLNVKSLPEDNYDQRLASANCASLFRQDRYGIDTSVPSTALEGEDAHFIDPELLVTSVNKCKCSLYYIPSKLPHFCYSINVYRAEVFK